MSIPSSRMSNLFQLDYPQSVGVFDTYEEAQKVVDFLADSKFPVENLCIVGTELRSVERVLGRRTWATVLGTGLQNGVTTGLLVAMLMWFVQPGENFLVLLAYALSMGLLIGVVISVAAHLMGRGRRDFTSVSQTVATKYEVLAEHKVAGMARELIATMPGARAAMFIPQARPIAPDYTGYGQSYPTGWPPAAPSTYPDVAPSGYQGIAPSGYPTAPPPPVMPEVLAPVTPEAPPSGGENQELAEPKPDQPKE